MKIVMINGNTKKEGFTAGCLEIVEKRLEEKGADVEYIWLMDAHIEYCRGCLACVKSGECPIEDDMTEIIHMMREADGFVVGSPVRNGLTTACYKAFFERITYLLGFSLDLEGKHTLAISSVGVGEGKSVNRKTLGLQTIFRTRLSDFLFFRVGMPPRMKPEEARDRLEDAADRLMDHIKAGTNRRLGNRVAARIDNWVCRKFLFSKAPDKFDYILECWKEKGYL